MSMELGMLLTKLRGRATDELLAECRRDVVRLMKGRGDVEMGRDVAERVFLDAARALAGHGYSEMEIRDLLSEEEGCADRAHARRLATSRPGSTQLVARA